MIMIFVTIKNRFLKIDFTIICPLSDHTMLSSETVFCILHIFIFFPKKCHFLYLSVFKTGLCACVRAHNIQGYIQSFRQKLYGLRRTNNSKINFEKN